MAKKKILSKDAVLCRNCGWRGDFNDMPTPIGETPDLNERLTPGDEVPAGECPKCKALCYLENPPKDTLAGQMKKDDVEGVQPLNKIFVVVDGGNVQSIHGPKTIEEVVMIDHDNGEADEETRLENVEAQAVLDMHLKAGRIIELY